MDVKAFKERFDSLYPPWKRGRVTWPYQLALVRRLIDPFPSVSGMASIKKLRLLRLAYSLLEPREGYLEIGTYRGKSLISAVVPNDRRPTYACDNFSEFIESSSEKILLRNLERYGVKDQVVFFNDDFRKILDRRFIKHSIGLYFYDGAHDFQSQYEAIKLAEPLLSDHALVVVDDWRFAEDSRSYAKAATLKAMEESPGSYELLYELPARRNADHAMWWNGVGVVAFSRQRV